MGGLGRFGARGLGARRVGEWTLRAQRFRDGCADDGARNGRSERFAFGLQKQVFGFERFGAGAPNRVERRRLSNGGHFWLNGCVAPEFALEALSCSLSPMVMEPSCFSMNPSAMNLTEGTQRIEGYSSALEVRTMANGG
jgi:hypothetical protein